MAREHCFYEDIFNYIVHGTFWAGASDIEKDKLHEESLNYSVIQGDLFYTNPSSRKLQQVITKATDKKHAILESHTQNDTSDHLNVKSTCFNLRKKYHWKTMESDVSNFIKTCQECNSVGNGDVFGSKVNGQVELLDRVWKLVEVEIIGPLQLQEKETFLLRITDVFSKWMSYNFLSEVNFKNMSDILLQEFSVMGFPAGIYVIGVENSEKFVDIFESTLKDFVDNINKINLLLSRDNKLTDLEKPINSCYEEHCDVNDYHIPLNSENSQNSSDCDTLNILKNAEVGHTSANNADTSACELHIRNTENGCEVNIDVKTVNVINCGEPKEAVPDRPGIDNCESNTPMENQDLTTESDRNCKNDVELSNNNIVTSVLPLVKNCENDMQMEIGAIESEVKEHKSSIESSKETETTSIVSSTKNYENGVQVKNESKLIDTECSVESTKEAKVSIADQENEICTETSNKTKISAVESENGNFNHKSYEETPDLQSILPSNDIIQSLHGKKDEVMSDINSCMSCQNENHTSSGQHSCCENIDSINNFPSVKIIRESKNTFKDLGDFEVFLKSGALNGYGMAGSLLYFLLAQQSLLDSETQNICRTHLQKFIKLFPDSWADKMPYFNFHIRNALSTSLRTPSQLLLHRDPHLLGLYENPKPSFQNRLQKEIFHANQTDRTSSVSPEDKHVQLSVAEGYRVHPLSISTSVRRHSKYGLRKSPKLKNSLGFSDQYVSPKKRPAGGNTIQDFTPPLKTNRLSRRTSSVKQKAIAKILKNYSLKNPVISLTPLPCSLVDSALQGKVDVIFLKKYIQLNCKKAN